MTFEYRKTKVIRAEVKTITPQMASDILDRNVGNRRLSPALVQEYASYMKQGMWQENGQAIQLTDDGFLVDGQHRLSAVVLANQSVPMLVVTVRATDGAGELNAIGMAIDRNKPRRHTDISGIDARADQIAGQMIETLMIGGHKKAKNTALRASVYYDLQDSIDNVIQRAGATQRLYSRAAIRAALALRHYQGYDHIDEYAAALRMNMKALSDTWLSWWRQVGQVEGHNGYNNKRLFTLTWSVTDPSQRDRSRITMRDSAVIAALNEATEVFYSACISSIASVELDSKATKKADGTMAFVAARA